MWRAILALSLLLTLALGATAEAKCGVCIQSMTADRSGGVTTFRVAVVRTDGVALPDTVKLSVDKAPGEITLTKSLGDTYIGTTTAFATSEIAALSGRVDIGGDVFTFNVPLNGSPATTQLITASAARQFASAAPSAVATVAPAAAPATAPAPDGTPVAAAAILLIGGAALLGTAGYLGRRRVTALIGTLIGG